MLDFAAHPFIGIYVILLILTGIGVSVMSVVNHGGRKVIWRVLGVLGGLAVLGYGVYLGFFFTGGTYFISFKVVLLPFFLLAGLIAKLREGRAKDAAAPQMYLPQQQGVSGVQVPGTPYAAQPQPGQPFGQPMGQPQQQPYDQFPQYGQNAPGAQAAQYQPVQPPVPQAPQGPSVG